MIFQELYVIFIIIIIIIIINKILSSSRSVDSANKKELNFVRQQIYLFVELIPHKTFPEDKLSFVRNVPDGSTVIRPAG